VNAARRAHNGARGDGGARSQHRYGVWRARRWQARPPAAAAAAISRTQVVRALSTNHAHATASGRRSRRWQAPGCRSCASMTHGRGHRCRRVLDDCTCRPRHLASTNLGLPPPSKPRGRGRAAPPPWRPPHRRAK
jgi:hypothetical protein